MQENTISVDASNVDAAVSDVTYGRHEETVNRTIYTSEDHSLASREMMAFYRTAPKRNGASRGSGKVSVKFTKDVSVPNANGDGDITLPMIGEISLSTPVGASAADMAQLRAEIGVLANNAQLPNVLKSLQETQEI